MLGRSNQSQVGDERQTVIEESELTTSIATPWLDGRPANKRSIGTAEWLETNKTHRPLRNRSERVRAVRIVCARSRLESAPLPPHLGRSGRGTKRRTARLIGCPHDCRRVASSLSAVG